MRTSPRLSVPSSTSRVASEMIDTEHDAAADRRRVGAEIGVKEGDEVLFGKYSGTDIKVDGEEIKILRESDILAKVVK